MENKDDKNEELLNKQLQLLAEKSQSSKCGLIKLLLISLVMVKIYRVIGERR